MFIIRKLILVKHWDSMRYLVNVSMSGTLYIRTYFSLDIFLQMDYIKIETDNIGVDQSCRIAETQQI